MFTAMTTDFETIPALFDATLGAVPDSIYLQQRQGEQIVLWTYREIAVAVDHFANELVAAGCAKNDHIALLGENSLEWIVAYLGILRAGCVVVPLDSLLHIADAIAITKMAHVRRMYCSKKFLETLHNSPLPGELPFPIDPFPDMRSLSQPASPIREFTSPDPDDLAVLIYTSGTTGNSKGVMLTHRNLTSNVLACCRVCRIEPGDNFLLLLPLHHAFSATVNMLLPVAARARATLATSFRSRDIVNDIQIGKITILVGVPQLFSNLMDGILRTVAKAGLLKRTIFRGLLQLSRALSHMTAMPGNSLFRTFRKKAGLNSIRLMVCGGAALSANVNHFFKRLGFELLQGYGMTECSPVLCVNHPGRNRIGSVGPPLPGVSLRIDHPDNAGIGEIMARGPNVMPGYYENEAATREVLDEGWLHTGDAGYLDSGYCLFITGRIKNLIVTPAGKNIYPEEIEVRLAEAPEIAEALVLGIQTKEHKGEYPCAILKLDEEYLLSVAGLETPDQIGARVTLEYNNTVPSYKQLRAWKLLEGEFEKTSTRKIKRYLYQDFF